MAGDFFFRAEDFTQEEVLSHLVETDTDRSIVNTLKGRSPVILRGSRGVGKSFLMRAADAELTQEFASDRILPVYVTFARASLITRPNADRFYSWMIAKLCNRIIRAASSAGVTLPGGSAIAAIRGKQSDNQKSWIERIEEQFEDSWKTSSDPERVGELPDPETLKDAIEDLCQNSTIRRVNLFVDEAAHVFIPEQQRQFFTLMRDLRSPYLAIKAAVYPGATAFGDSFQPVHDATILSIDRPVTDPQYARAMRQIVYKQDDSLQKVIDRQGEVFDTLAYAATGNPRILLKTLARSMPFNRRNAQDAIKQYYREEIWSEHSNLADRYPGHRDLIDWGRSFIEGDVLPQLHRGNTHRKTGMSSYIWIHRDAPQVVREALRLLCYSGILQEGISGIRATRSEVGTRYMVNLGCQFAIDGEPIAYGSHVQKGLAVGRMVEFGANHATYRPIRNFAVSQLDSDDNAALEARLKAPSTLLDVTAWQQSKLQQLGLKTIGDVLASDESVFKSAYYVGPTRARQMRNAAVAAVLEYLSG